MQTTRRRTQGDSPVKTPGARERARAGMYGRGKQKSFFNKYGYHIVIGGFIFVCLASIFFVMAQKTIDIKTTPVIDEDAIAAWNAEAERYSYTFRTGSNEFFEGMMLEDAKYTMNNIFYRDGQSNRLHLCKVDDDGTLTPEKYNFREEYPNCAAPIQNQGNCSANYAVTAASTLADRFCLKSEDQERVALNAQTYTSCDNKQKLKTCGDGGVLVSFLEFVRSRGLVDEQCMAYDNQAWDADCPTVEMQDCERYKIFDFCVIQKVEDIKREIMANGPVITASQIYLDLLTYKEGVYQYVEGEKKFRGLQQWKIIGWDVDENNEQYWIAENTWGETWGENGLFRIMMGQEKNFFGQMAFSPRPRVTAPAQDLSEDQGVDEFQTGEDDDEEDLDLEAEDEKDW